MAAVLFVAEHLPARLRTEHADQLARPFIQGHITDGNVCDWYAVKALHTYLTPSGPAEPDRAARVADPVAAFVGDHPSSLGRRVGWPLRGCVPPVPPPLTRPTGHGPSGAIRG